MDSIDEVLAGYEGIQAGQEAFYKDLHAHPELSHAEHRTAERVAGKLQEDGFSVQAGIGGTGLVGVLANGRGPTVLLRAELDALPLREDTGADYASTVTVRDADGREVPVALLPADPPAHARRDPADHPRRMPGLRLTQGPGF
jgi:hypothetical protein